jgi:hypothetical protein
MNDESRNILKNMKVVSIDYRDDSTGFEHMRPSLLKRTLKITPSNIQSKPDIQIFKPIKLDGNSPVSKKESDFLTYRTNYMLKFSRNFEIFDRIFAYFEYFSEGSKRYITDLFYKMKSVNETRDRIIFEKPRAECNIEFYKSIVSMQYEQEVAYLRLLENSLKEVRKYREENNELSRRENEVLAGREDYLKELARYRKIIEDNGVNQKDIVRKKKLIEASKVKEEYEKRERVNMIQNFRLEEE